MDTNNNVDVELNHKCSCGKSYLTEIGLMSHIRKAHRDPKLVKQEKTVVKKEKKKCLECPIQFDVDDCENIFMHWETDHRYDSEEENPYSSDDYAK